MSPKKNKWIKRRFKKSGEFDRLRRELLTQFQNGVWVFVFHFRLSFVPTCADSRVLGKKKKWQDGTEAFWERVDDIARTRLDAEDKLHLKAADTLHRELLQELDRYVGLPSLPSSYSLPPDNRRALRGRLFFGCRCRFPLVERAVADVPALADPEFAAGIRGHAENLLKRSQSIPGGAFPPGVILALVLTMTTNCVVFFLFLFGLGVEEDVSRSQSNGGARDDAVGGRRNGADEGPRRDEGMEISDG